MVLQELIEIVETIINDVPALKPFILLAVFLFHFNIVLKLLSYLRGDFIGIPVNIDSLSFEKEVMEVKPPKPTAPPQERENVMICATFPKKESADYWKCPYCDGLNENIHLVCVHCGAARIN